MLLVVVFLMMVQLVELSLFLLFLLFLMQVGTLVLLYHHTHYTIHGGTSGNGDNCGAFSIYTYFAASHGVWAIGAALSFKL